LLRVSRSALDNLPTGVETQNGVAPPRSRSGQTDLLETFPSREMGCHPAGSSGVSTMTIVALGILAVVILLIVLAAVNGSQSTL
jgi:hypothetical protein